MTGYESRKVEYTMMVLAEYARARGVTLGEGFFELLDCGGVEALDEFYDIEHTLPVSTTVDDLLAMRERGAA